jgi:branched-chain amino acid transport system permease protein
VIWQALILLFGTAAYPYVGPAQGVSSLGAFAYSSYRLVLLGFGIALAASLLVISRYTTLGLIARAVMSNRDLAQGVGLNTLAIRRWTFILGSFLAGAAGALLAPLAPVNPYLGFGYLIPAFLTVLLAGRSVVGFILAAILLSGGQTIVSLFVNQVVAGVVVVLIAVIVLRLIPAGFDGLRRVA